MGQYQCKTLLASVLDKEGVAAVWQQCGSSRVRTETNGTENTLEEKLDFRLK